MTANLMVLDSLINTSMNGNIWKVVVVKTDTRLYGVSCNSDYAGGYLAGPLIAGNLPTLHLGPGVTHWILLGQSFQQKKRVLKYLKGFQSYGGFKVGHLI